MLHRSWGWSVPETGPRPLPTIAPVPKPPGTKKAPASPAKKTREDGWEKKKTKERVEGGHPTPQAGRVFVNTHTYRLVKALTLNTGLSCHALPWTCDRFATDPLGLSRIGRYPGTLWEVV